LIVDVRQQTSRSYFKFPTQISLGRFIQRPERQNRDPRRRLFAPDGRGRGRDSDRAESPIAGGQNLLLCAGFSLSAI